MKKILQLGSLILVIIIFGVVMVLGYLGFVPGLSSLFGSDRARDLGVEFTEQHYQAARDKTRVELTDLPATTDPVGSITYSGSHSATIAFTSEELTSLTQNRKWKYFPVKDWQVKINTDGTVETSGVIRTSRILDWATATNFAKSDVKQALDAFDVLLTDPPFYVKGTASVTNDTVSLNIQKAEIGRLSLSSDIVRDYTPKITSAVGSAIKGTAGLSVKSLRFSNGTMQFDGTLPDKESSVNQ